MVDIVKPMQDADETRAERYFFEVVWPVIKVFLLMIVLAYIGILPDSIRSHWMAAFIVMLSLYTLWKHFLNPMLAAY